MWDAAAYSCRCELIPRDVDPQSFFNRYYLCRRPPEGAIYEVLSLAVYRASKSSNPNRTTTRENNENKETRHA